MIIMKTCSIHGEAPHVVYPERTRCKLCQADAVVKFRRNLKKKAIKYKGSRCNSCGHSFEHPEVYEFHHLDPTKKDFGISASGNTRSWTKVQTELDKCIMLCANCHRILHAEQKTSQP